MYAEELVQKWIDEKRSYISENEIKSYGLTGQLALMILQSQYEAHYVPSTDLHFCGEHYFKNPLGHAEKRYGLHSLLAPDGRMVSHGCYYTYDEAVKEIVRFEYDDIYWHHEEEIPKYIGMVKDNIIHDMYYNNSRYWFIWEEEIWTV